MAEVLINGNNIVCAISRYLYVLSDDGVTYYPYTLVYDGMLGIYAWNRLEASTPPSDAIDISNVNLGTEFAMADTTGAYHGFSMLPSELMDAFVWTDVDQAVTPPTFIRRYVDAKATNGIHLMDTSGSQFHKLTDVGGIWSETAQGYTVPL